MSTNTTPRPRTFLQKLRRFVILFVLAGGVLLGLYTWAAWSFAYSEGERAGYVQKFSRKGWICKTWEGELAMANLPGAMPQIFSFTVVNAEVASQINAAMGERVTVHYKEHVGLPTTCFGDTTHFVDKIRPIDKAGIE